MESEVKETGCLKYEADHDAANQDMNVSQLSKGCKIEWIWELSLVCVVLVVCSAVLNVSKLNWNTCLRYGMIIVMWLEDKIEIFLIKLEAGESATSGKRIINATMILNCERPMKILLFP